MPIGSGIRPWTGTMFTASDALPLKEPLWHGLVTTGILVSVLGKSVAAHRTCWIWPTHGGFFGGIQFLP